MECRSWLKAHTTEDGSGRNTIKRYSPLKQVTRTYLDILFYERNILLKSVQPRESEVTEYLSGASYLSSAPNLFCSRQNSSAMLPRSLALALAPRPLLVGSLLSSFHIHFQLPFIHPPSTVHLHGGRGEGDTIHALLSTPIIYRSLLTTDENETKICVVISLSG